MEILNEIKTVQWIVKVINSCKTLEQRENAGRLAKQWIISKKPNVVRCSQKTWDNYLALGHYMADVSQAKEKELINQIKVTL